MKTAWTRWWLVAALPLWLLAAGAGLVGLNQHARTPGLIHAPPETWPGNVPIPHTAGVASLVVFLHPECPCSRSTVTELSRLLSKNPRSLRVTACLAQWGVDRPENSMSSALRRIPDVEIIADWDGNIAKRFGAETSGTTAFYDESGRLLFFGGITEARGHEGDNAGEDVLIALLRGNSSSSSTRRNVYGCSIF